MRGPFGHPCGDAHHALREAGYAPEVTRCYGLGHLPDALNRTRGRREVKRLTGRTMVPVLVTDEGDVVTESKAINRLGARAPDRLSPAHPDHGRGAQSLAAASLVRGSSSHHAVGDAGGSRTQRTGRAVPRSVR